MNERKVLAHLVKAGRDALHLENVLTELGYKETPYYAMYGEITDAIYCLLNEETDTFDESATHKAMNDIYSTDTECADKLYDLYKRNSQLWNPLPHVPESVVETITRVAEERRLRLDRMISIILCEWVIKYEMLKA